MPSEPYDWQHRCAISSQGELLPLLRKYMAVLVPLFPLCTVSERSQTLRDAPQTFHSFDESSGTVKCDLPKL